MHIGGYMRTSKLLGDTDPAREMYKKGQRVKLERWNKRSLKTNRMEYTLPHNTWKQVIYGGQKWNIVGLADQQPEPDKE
jgi:hypothetical protein